MCLSAGAPVATGVLWGTGLHVIANTHYVGQRVPLTIGSQVRGCRRQLLCTRPRRVLGDPPCTPLCGRPRHALQRISVTFMDKRGVLVDAPAVLVAVDTALDLAVFELQERQSGLAPAKARLLRHSLRLRRWRPLLRHGRRCRWAHQQPCEWAR